MTRLRALGLVMVTMALSVVAPRAANVDAASLGCTSVSGRARYIFCVDISSQRATLRRVSYGKVGTAVLGPYTVTTSRIDTGEGDSITKLGHFMAYGPMRYSYSGLEYFIRFYGGQGLHAYGNVGPGFDSHGCIRQTYWVAATVWNKLVAGREGNLVSAGRVEIHIYP